MFFLLWIAFITIGYIIGKNLEHEPDVNRKHIVVSLILTFTPFLLIVIHQVRVGNIGPKSDSILCSDFCSQNGYLASAIPPTNSGQEVCGCYDDFGNEALKVPISDIVPNKK
jgi:hypothetical protein